MAGMGEALGLMLAGGAGNAASNRAADIREEEKAQVAAAREQKLAQYKEGLKRDTAVMTEDLQRETNRQTDERRSVENQKDRDSRFSIASMQEAGANSRNAASIAGADRRAEVSAGGVDAKTGKRMQGSTQWFKDENGKPIYGVKTFRDGSDSIVYPDQVEGYRGDPASSQNALADAETFAKNVVSDKTGWFSTDKKDLKEYGGSREAAKEQIKRQWLADHGFDNNGQPLASGGGGGGKEDTPAAPAGNAPVPQQRQQAQQPQRQQAQQQEQQDITSGMNSAQASLFSQAKAALPNATDEQVLEALMSDQRYAKYFSQSQ